MAYLYIRFISFTMNLNHSSIFSTPNLLINIFFPSDPNIAKRYGSLMTLFSTYLGPISRLILFTLCQSSSWTWRHTTFTHLVVWRSRDHFHSKTFGASLRFSSCSLIISLLTIFSVSTNCSRASFYVGVHPTYPLFLSLLPGVHMINTKSNHKIINGAITLVDKQAEIMATLLLGVLWWQNIVHKIRWYVIV